MRGTDFMPQARKTQATQFASQVLLIPKVVVKKFRVEKLYFKLSLPTSLEQGCQVGLFQAKFQKSDLVSTWLA